MDDGAPQKRIRKTSHSNPSPDDTASLAIEPDETGRLTPPPSDSSGPAQTLDFSVDDKLRQADASRSGGIRPPSWKLPGYRVLRELGRGAMGVVYLARQEHADRDVALKMMLNLEHARAEDLERFRVEARASAHLQHPNIVQLYEAGEHAGTPYFSLEYVRGGTLAQKISRQLLGHRETAEMMLQLSQAIAFAHVNGVIHRDLKPANLLITPDGKLKISDFGLARRVEDQSHLTRDGTIIGTPSYMAPEQASGSVQQIGPLSDVYAIGAILYELLTGRPPFKGATVWEVIGMVCTREPTPPSELQPNVPKDLETICLKCLQKDPVRRYESATALAEDIQRHLNLEPILARPIGQGERFVRLCRRHPREAKLIGILAGMLTLFAIGASWAAVRMSHQRDQIAAEKQTSDARLLLYRDSVSEFVNRVPQLLEGVPLAGGVRTAIGNMTSEILASASESDGSDVGAANDWGREAIAIRRGDLKLSEALAARQNSASSDQFQALLADAETEFASARGIAEQVHQSGDGDRSKALANLALAISRQAATRQTAGRYADAAKLFQSAIELRTESAEQPTGESPRSLRLAELGRELANLAELQMQTGQSAEAMQSTRRSIDAIKIASAELPDDHPSHPNVRRDLALAANLRAQLAMQLGDDDEAIDGFEMAVSTHQSLTDQFPDRPSFRQNLVATANQYGDFLLLHRNDPAAARKQYVVAMLQLRQLFLDPVLQRIREDGLAMSYYRLGLVAVAQSDAAKAQNYFERCELIRELDFRQLQDLPAAKQNPDILLTQRISLMLAQARAGNVESATEQARLLIRRAQDDDPLPGSLDTAQLYLQAAAAFGIASQTTDDETQKSEYRTIAMRSLAAAIRVGFADEAYLQTDPDLASLREMPDFAVTIQGIP